MSTTSSTDEDCILEDDVPVPVSNSAIARYDAWAAEYADELLECYYRFMEIGNDYFGNSFFQLGNLSHFLHFVYFHTDPQPFVRPPSINLNLQVPQNGDDSHSVRSGDWLSDQ